MISEKVLIYPCHICGNEFDMGSDAVDLTLEQRSAILRRVVGDMESRVNQVVGAMRTVKRECMAIESLIKEDHSKNKE
jgi:hypothetical protein